MTLPSSSFAGDTVTSRNKGHQGAGLSCSMTLPLTGYDAFSSCHLSRRCKALCTDPTVTISSFVERKRNASLRWVHCVATVGGKVAVSDLRILNFFLRSTNYMLLI